MRTWLLYVLVLAVLAIISGCGGGAGSEDPPLVDLPPPPPSELTGEIVFTWGSSVRVIQANGTGFQSIPANCGGRIGASQDGRYVATTNLNTMGYPELRATDRETGVTMLVTTEQYPGAMFESPFITPDNKYIYFTRYNLIGYERYNDAVFRVDLSYNVPFSTRSPLGGFIENAISPDATMLTFVSDYNQYELNGSIWYERDGIYRIRTLRLGGGYYTVTLPTIGREPSFSPDNQHIVFQRGGVIYQVSADGTGEMQLTDGAIPCYSPCYNPDGSMIVYVAYPGEPYNSVLFIQRIADGQVWALTRDTGRLYRFPYWIPGE